MSSTVLTTSMANKIERSPEQQISDLATEKLFQQRLAIRNAVKFAKYLGQTESYYDGNSYGLSPDSGQKLTTAGKIMHGRLQTEYEYSIEYWTYWAARQPTRFLSHGTNILAETEELINDRLRFGPPLRYQSFEKMKKLPGLQDMISIRELPNTHMFSAIAISYIWGMKRIYPNISAAQVFRDLTLFRIPAAVIPDYGKDGIPAIHFPTARAISGIWNGDSYKVHIYFLDKLGLDRYAYRFDFLGIATKLHRTLSYYASSRQALEFPGVNSLVETKKVDDFLYWQ